MFIALHGKGGEDGSIQGYLELSGIKYTGPGIAASAICMDKILTKRLLKSVDLPTPDFMVIASGELMENRTEISDYIKVITDQIKFPMVVKAPCEGSSIGVYMVNDEDGLKESLLLSSNLGKEILIEEFISGIELTLPILGNQDVECLPIIEITSKRAFYDYTAKYTNGMCQHIIPACIDKKTEKEVINLGTKAYKTIGCSGISRIDFIIDSVKGPQIIEINTSPGMTDMSLFPDAARYAGMPYLRLIENILDLGLQSKR